jgi:PAS domain S-box-containing protein
MNAISSQAYFADLLAQSSFAGQLRSDAPLLLASKIPPRIVFANEAALAAFGAKDLDQVSAAATAGTSAGARRLRQLAVAVTPDGGRRLELLRFYVGRMPMQLAAICAPIVDSSGEAYLVIASPGEAPQGVPADGPGPQATPPPPTAAGSGAAPRRFLWSVDQNFCFDAAAEALADAVADRAPHAAESLEALKARTGLDATGELARALARQETFGPLRLKWPRPSPEEGADDAVVVLLSGAPLFDRQRQFLGYRGFGVFTGETTPFESRRQVPESHRTAPAPPPSDRNEDAAPPRFETEEEERDAAELIAPVSSFANDDEPRDPPASEPRTHFEGGAEIVALRTPDKPYAGGPNVVPIRPGALRQFPPSDERPRSAGDDESVELTSHERDAFREIARALGAKIRDNRDERSASKPAGSDESTSPTQARERDVADAHADAIAAGQARSSAYGPDGENHKDLLDRLPIGALVARGGRALYLNRTLLDLLGYQDLEQFRASSALSHIFNGRQLDEIALPGEGGPLSLKSTDGESIAVDAQTQEIEWDDAPATLISLRRPIEALLAAKIHALELAAQTRESEARELSAVLDTATDGVVVLDAQGKILSLNRSGQALFGFDQKDVARDDFLTLFSPESREAVKIYFDGLRSNGIASLLNDGREALGRERHGRTIPLFVTLGRINSSQTAKFCAVLRDMTQWKTIERDLEEARGQAEKASALKSEFLAKISHEIRTPLNAILGFAEVIMDERFGPVDNERYKEYLKDIHSSGSHVMSLINDLLDLSKIEAGKLDLHFAAVDANSIIQECVSLMQPQAAQERIIMRLSLSDKLPRIIADERSLRQIMLNLMSNAVKFNEPGGQVIVSTAVNEAGQAVIRVRDTGIGMSEAEIGLALEPFRRISTSRQTGGTGLGLPLTKALVEANRAGFSIKSRKQQGTLVEVAFPIAQAAAAQ